MKWLVWWWWWFINPLRCFNIPIFGNNYQVIEQKINYCLEMGINGYRNPYSLNSFGIAIFRPILKWLALQNHVMAFRCSTAMPVWGPVPQGLGHGSTEVCACSDLSVQDVAVSPTSKIKGVRGIQGLAMISSITPASNGHKRNFCFLLPSTFHV